MKIKKNLNFIITMLLIMSLVTHYNVFASIHSDSGGSVSGFGTGSGSAVVGTLSGIAGVKVSLYNVDTNSFGYTFAITNSDKTRSTKLFESQSPITVAVGTRSTHINYVAEAVTTWKYTAFDIPNSKWAGTEDGGFTYDDDKVKSTLCGSAPGNGCDATKAFYTIANHLTSHSGSPLSSCYMQENAAGDLNLSESCQQTLSKYRIILEPIYAFTASPYNYYTLKGIGAIGAAGGVHDDPHFGLYITTAIDNAKASNTHGAINSGGLPSYNSLDTYNKYRLLADKTTGYGYNIFYLNPEQVEIHTPPDPITVGSVPVPPVTPTERNETNETLMCNNGINSLYMTSTYTYSENSSIQSANPYCDVTCDTNVELKTPNVFSVTSAGRNFELVYEPTIKATKTCQSKFNYNQWKYDYELAIEYEKTAIEKYNQAIAMEDQADNISYDYVSECNCSTTDGVTTCYDSQYKITSAEVYYKTKNSSTSKKKIDKIQDYFCTEDGDIDDYIETTYETPAATAVTTSKGILKDRAKKRLSLEKYNLQCYTSLDSANMSSEINNIDIFPENYNTYKATDGTPYTKDIKVTTNLETLNSVSSGTGSTYSSYIPGGGISLNTNIIERKSTLDLFEFQPKLKFIYENGLNSSGAKTKADEETMLTEAAIAKDSGPYTEGNTTKNISTQNISKYIYYDFGKTEHLSFNAYKMGDIYRTIEYTYKFHEGTEYCGNLKGGEIKKCKDVIGDTNYRTLSSHVKYTNKGNTAEKDYYNHNYPVKLNAKSDNYEVEFNLEQNGVLLEMDDFTGKFKCHYPVTKDLINLDNKNLEVLFRSVSTSNLDPNNRFDKNKFGENWIGEKGKAIKNIIELNSVDVTSNTHKNTYNPDNLEYSFTLTPKLITAMKEYNKNYKYSEYSLTCNQSGMQCLSTFLTELSEGKIDGITIENNYTTQINTFNIANTRAKWKYYLKNGSALGCNQIRSDVENMYTCSYNTIQTTDQYNNFYRGNGVLP